MARGPIGHQMGVQEPRGDRLALCFQDRNRAPSREETHSVYTASYGGDGALPSLVHSSSLKLRTLSQLPLNWGRAKAKLLGYCVGMMVSPAVLESPAHCQHPSRLWAKWLATESLLEH